MVQMTAPRKEMRTIVAMYKRAFGELTIIEGL